MISEFIDSWELFGPAYLSALAGAAMLSLVGIYVVARDQIFLAAAVSQSSMLGVAVVLFFGKGNPAIAAVVFSIAAAVFINRRTGNNAATHQETTGWVFLTASAMSILLMVKQPFGLKEVQSLASSSMIGATMRDAAQFAILAFALGALAILQRRRLILWLGDPVMAAAAGVKIGLWSLGSAIILGLSSGLMLRSTGLLFTFGCLALPALAAKYLSKDLNGMLWLAPAVAITGVLPGLALAHHFDMPPGQVAVVALAVLTAGAAAFRRLRQAMSK